MLAFKCSANAFTDKTDIEVQHTCFSCGVAALQGENLPEAYLCFSPLTDSPAALFNLALCYHKAQMHEQARNAIECAEKTLSSRAITPFHHNAIPTELLQHDAQSTAYCMPMTEQTVTLFPALAKLRIFRLMADIYGELGCEQDFMRIIPLFAGTNYKNIVAIKKKFGERTHENQRT